jgi:hypothetical protein
MSQDFPKRIRNRISPAKAWRELTADRRNSTSPIRWDLVKRVRAEIAAGTYDTPQKFAAAVERMSLSLLA